MNPMSVPPLVPDPGERTRSLIALLLRLGLGINLLHTGLSGYMAIRTGGGSFGAVVPGQPGVESIYWYLPYLEIAVGLALLLGFFTKVAAALGGLLSLSFPLLQIAMMLVGGAFQNFNRNPFFGQLEALMGMSTTSNLLLVAVVLWLSPVGSNRWSLDALMFPPRDVPPSIPAVLPEPAKVDVPQLEPREPAAPPGERSARFIANREE